MKGEYAESTVARVLMDYGYLHEEETVKEGEHGKEVESKVSMTVMVMMETLCSSVWAYALDGKGAASVDWLARQVVEDIETVGLSKERIITKTDQEASIVQLQQEVAKHRQDAGTALENSRVGDSDSNGKIERTIREVKGMIRTFRCHLEEKTGKPIRLDDAIVPWIVRHAAYVITRFRVGEDGKTAMHNIKGRKLHAPMIPFGETVLLELQKVPRMPGDFKDRFETGTWVGCTVRSGEHLVATEGGVFKVSSVIRRSEDKRWSAEKIHQMKGNPQEPVPGTGSSKIVAYAKHKDTGEDSRVEYMPRAVTEEPEVRANYIYKKDVEEHGASPGCPGCRALLNPNSRYRAKHTEECKDRMEAAMVKSSHQSAMRVVRAHERHNSAKARSEVPTEKRTEQAEGEQASKKGRQGEEHPERQEAASSSSGARGEPAEAGDSKMEESDEQHELESAPGKKADIRVPLAERKPAEKRVRDATSESPRGSKWVAYETEVVGGSKRSLEDGTKPDGPKVQVVEDDQSKTVDSLKTHPGPRVREEDIERAEMSWKDIGSGTVARTFIKATKLLVSTRGGPPTEDVHRRTVWNLSTGRIIDDCVVDDTPDDVLYRELPEETNIRVELVLKDAISMYQRQGADVVEIFSQPRIAQEAGMRTYGGTRLVPGWSLDLTRSDPKTGKAWDLSDKVVQSRVVKMIQQGQPLFIIGSPPRTAMSVMQNLNRNRRDPEVIRREVQAAEEHVKFCIRLYKMQIESRRYFVHEHPSEASF